MEKRLAVINICIEQQRKKYDSITEIDADSPFYTHKLNIIRNSLVKNQLL